MSPPAIRPGGLVRLDSATAGDLDLGIASGSRTSRRTRSRTSDGINLLHGYLSRASTLEDEAYVVPLPDILAGVGVLLEPLTISEKGVHQGL
jgi:hypothetical protein